MTREELEQKVINAEATVAKRRETLRKHREQLERKIEKGAEPWEIEIKRDDIKCAEGKLEEAKRTLQNWRDKLGERVSRDAFIEANTPEVMKDFLEQWRTFSLQTPHTPTGPSTSSCRRSPSRSAPRWRSPRTCC